jgi:hypothetical protein
MKRMHRGRFYVGSCVFLPIALTGAFLGMVACFFLAGIAMGFEFAKDFTSSAAGEPQSTMGDE